MQTESMDHFASDVNLYVGIIFYNNILLFFVKTENVFSYTFLHELLFSHMSC